LILSRLIQRIAAAQTIQRMGTPMGDAIDIQGIHYRAQEVKEGGMFFALKGQSADGHDYIPIAIERGAAAVVVETPVAIDAPCFLVNNTRKALSGASAEFFGNPSGSMTLVGITGTNGKTTTAHLVENLFQNAGYSAGLLGTIYSRYAGQHLNSPLTTPESVDLQRMLSDMRERGVTHAVMEVSSHALALSRVDDCLMDVGVFTNLSRDHLDFHRDMEDYWAAKKRLFMELLQQGPKKDRAVAVFNCNDPRGKTLLKQFPGVGIGVGSDPENAVWAECLRSDISGIRAVIHTPAGAFELNSALIGRHNLENLLCAAGVGIALGFSLETIRDGLETLGPIPGRFETIPDPAGRHVIIDYAHTPDALENALKAMRALNPKRVITVFGCGGNRDRKKRPLMGEIAGRFSDVVILTSDNPRKEDPMAIIREIKEGLVKTCPRERDSLNSLVPDRGEFMVEPDRRKAIRLGIRTARPGDAVLIAGKGHETYQIRGEKTVHFDDREEAAGALSMDPEKAEAM